MRFFLYARKSTDTEDKQVLSIEAQLVELRALARRGQTALAFFGGGQRKPVRKSVSSDDGDPTGNRTPI